MLNRILILLLIAIGCAIKSFAIKTEYDYVGRPLVEALTDFCKRNPEVRLSFIYDELEEYRVKKRVSGDNPFQIIKSLVELNPVSVTIEGEEVYIEALQKGKYRYTGRTIEGLSGEPVTYATVLLLNPKDSTTLTYGITDDKGYFSIPCDRKNVLARFSSVGYKTMYLRNSRFSMGDVRMDVYARKLGEITIREDRSYAMSDRVVYVPGGRERRAAQDGVSLLQFMAIPSIRVSGPDKSVTTLSGENVAMFIDCLPASETDIKSLRPEDVKKVEILDYPSDPRFEGVNHAVNFIMVKYEYGGYTTLAVNQKTDFDYGYYSLSSKFTRGKLTYDLYTGFDHFTSDRENTSNVTAYDFDGREVERTVTTPESDIEMNEAYASTRVKYVVDKKVVSNQISVRYAYVPSSFSLTDNVYTPSIYPSGEARQSMRRHSFTPSWRGNYQFSLPHSLRLVMTPNLTFSHNTHYAYFTENKVENVRDVSEDTWAANLGGTLAKSWGNHSLSVSINGEVNDNRLDYRGNNPAKIHYNDRAVGCRVRGTFNFGILRLQPSVRFYYKWTRFDDLRYTQPLPGYYISGSLDLGRKQQLSFSSEMSNWTIGVSYRSPNIVVQNLLDAVKGNPNLKSWRYTSGNLDYVWLVHDWLNFGAYASYKHHTRPMEYVFVPSEIDGREMMLCTYVKDGYYQIFSEGLSAGARLFNNSLTIQAQAGISSHHKHGHAGYRRTVLNGDLFAIYYFGNFHVNASYEFREKGANQYERIYDHPSYYSLSGGLNIKGWNVEVQLKNLFRSSYKKGVSHMDYSNYKTTSVYYGTAYRRSIWLKATYTFRYGKKVKEERIDRGSSASSGIVK